ncbi:GntR family transcriptional regulator [Catellatospora methionotrophica]|uniref:GntR family transcriptional regulator n=1 Tax=Catellatospora methionotrophica TaxID=121620 RepID=A0A8J3LEN6_9ACTN|nr:GntR family transcriptional regulator [Catellatospora methionotrophica]GIG17902.1 GntR family transcriptional regulator [Catellatospora methionotrophica]
MAYRDARPRHHQIAAELRALIMSGELATGTRLESTQQLMTRFAVTGQTVQRALAVLKDEGFVVGRAGLGVFVRDLSPLAIEPAAYMPPARPGAGSRWTDGGGHGRGRIHLVDVREVQPPASVAVALGLADGVGAQLRQQVLFLDDEPVELAWLYFPLDLARGTALAERRLVRGGIPRLLAEAGHPPVDWTDRISARSATTEEARLLELPGEVPVLRTARTVRTDGGRPIEASVLVKGAHRYELSYHQVVAPAGGASQQ